MRKVPPEAPCHACLLRLDRSRPPNPRSSWRRICDECADNYVTSPLLVPNERVRICPDSLGVWGQSREIYQSWDTGLGAVIPARKYYLSPAQTGRVAVVLQDAADAETVDCLFAPQSVKPDRPFRLRYCPSIKSFCADECFGTAQDKSCSTHIKQRKREQQGPTENKGGGRLPKREAEAEHGPATVGWLLDEVVVPDESHEEDFGTFALGDIYDLSGVPSPRGPSCSSTASTATPRDLPPPVELCAAPWSGEEEDTIMHQDTIMDRLDTLLGSDEGAMSWSQTAVDVAFDDVLGAALIAGAPLGRNDQSNAKRIGKALPIKGVNAPISKHVTPSSKHMWAKRHPGVAQKMGKPLTPSQQMGEPVPSISQKVGEPTRQAQGPTSKAKCVWKQQIMW